MSSSRRDLAAAASAIDRAALKTNDLSAAADRYHLLVEPLGGGLEGAPCPGGQLTW